MPTWTSGVAAAALTAAALLGVPAGATQATPLHRAAATEVVGGPDLASPGIVVRPGHGSTPLPAISADTWLVADLTTGEVLAAKGAHTRVLPASTLKTLTSVTLMPKLDPNQVVTATEFDTRAEGSHVGLVVGGTYTVRDLWNALLLPSANDAAAALAEANGGFAKTVAEMAQEAHRLQADDTTPKTPSGLDTPGQYSSAYDMALIARAALAIPQFQVITRTMRYDFPGKPVAPGAKRSTYQIYTENRLLRHHYRGTIGGKTGFTSLAHRTFWGAASRGGHTIVVTLFQIHEPTESAARKLLDWGFANTGKVTPVGTLVAPLPDPASDQTSASSGVTGGGSTTASGTAASTSSSLPWKKLGLGILVLAAVGAGILWWRRRQVLPAADGGPAPERRASRAEEPAAPPRAARHERPAAARTPSVVVSGTGPQHEAPPIAADPTDAPTDHAAVEPPSQPAPAPPASTGNVRLITPPSRPGP